MPAEKTQRVKSLWRDEVGRVGGIAHLHRGARGNPRERAGKVTCARRVLVKLGLLDSEEQRGLIRRVVGTDVGLSQILQGADDKRPLKAVALSPQVRKVVFLSAAKIDTGRLDREPSSR